MAKYQLKNADRLHALVLQEIRGKVMRDASAALEKCIAGLEGSVIPDDQLRIQLNYDFHFDGCSIAVLVASDIIEAAQ